MKRNMNRGKKRSKHNALLVRSAVNVIACHCMCFFLMPTVKKKISYDQ